MQIKQSLVTRLAKINLLFLFCAAFLTYSFTSYFKNSAYEREERNRMHNLAISTATSIKNFVAGLDYASIAKPVEELMKNNSDVALTVVRDEKNKIIQSTDRALLKRLKQKGAPGKRAAFVDYTDPLSGRTVRTARVTLTERGLSFGTLFLFYYPSSPLEREREKNFIALGQSIVTSVVELFANYQYFELAELTENVIKGHKDILYCAVVDTENLAIFHTDKALTKKKLKDALSRRAMERTSPTRPTYIQRAKMKGQDVVDIALILERDGKKIGLLRLGYSLSSLRNEEARQRFRLFLFVILLSFSGIAAMVFAARQIAKPILNLSKLARDVGTGNLGVQADVPQTQDEVAFLSHSFNEMITGLKERERVKDAFSRYVTKDVMEKALYSKDGLELGGERRKVTIMYADVRGFTSLSENMKPEEVVSLLNEYFDIMVSVVFKYEGTLDKFIGDCIMAVFGAPLYSGNDTENAVRSALEMQARIKEFNEERKRQNKKEIGVGIGVNTGHAVAGNIGSKQRIEYTVIGDTVNTASRIQGLAGKGEILLSESTYLEMKDKVEVIPLPPVRVKGKEEAVPVYRLVCAAESEDRLRHAEKHKEEVA